MAGGAGLLISGRYLLVEAVGQGGMGRVWRGRDQVLDREVAVKEVLLPPNLPPEAHAELLARTVREARAAARLDHPSVITIHDVVDHDGTPWIVMRLVHGPSLRAEIERLGRLPWQRVAAIGEQVADALTEAHAAGITHRDLKPDNILLSGQRAVVTDFGIAHVADATTKLTSTGSMIGTPQYMAPEQFDDRPVGPATDMWALGATLYAATEGRPPFDASTLSSVIGAVLTKSPAAPEHAGPLAVLIQSLLTRDAAQRPGAALVARSLAAQRTPAPAAAPTQAPAARTVGEVPPVAVPALDSTVTAGQPESFTGTVSDEPGHGHVTMTVARGSATPSPASPPVTSTAAGKPSKRWLPRKPRAIALSATAAAAVIAAAVILPLALEGNPPASLVATFAVPDGNVVSAAFSPDSKSLATGDSYGRTILWDAVTGKAVATLTDPGGFSAYSVAFAPDGKTIAAGSYDGNTYFWDTASRKLIRSLPNPANVSILAVAFSPDGKILARGDNNGNIHLWDTTTGDYVTALIDPGNRSVYSVAFAPDGKIIATGDYVGNTYLWDATTKKITAKLTDPSGEGVISAAFAPDGKTLATGDQAGEVHLWDTATGKILQRFTVPDGDAIGSVVFTADGKSVSFGAGHDSYLWDPATGKTRAIVTGSSKQDNSLVAFAPDGFTIATTDDGDAYLWRVKG
jgi:serine/threonine protein kinase